jgi:hypothetical protein
LAHWAAYTFDNPLRTKSARLDHNISPDARQAASPSSLQQELIKPILYWRKSIAPDPKNGAPCKALELPENQFV